MDHEAILIWRAADGSLHSKAIVGGKVMPLSDRLRLARDYLDSVECAPNFIARTRAECERIWRVVRSLRRT